ncbi:hypothetical protein HDU67_008795 [Dinochytrium kinnereticum]|nr:hypothetical protein HDU67_008795 [Dinochytrium kinnereticum]
MSAPRHALIDSPGEKGIRIGGWTIITKKAPILNSTELDRAAERLPNLTFPEMLFGNNELRVSHEPSGTALSFNALDALALVDASPTAGSKVQVSYAKEWAAKSLGEEHQKLKNLVKSYDWTYSTDYNGTVVASQKAFEPTEESVDIERLKRPDPILFYDDVVLFEDELADNGSCILNVRVRVMPTCFLVLLRLFLRVDEVLFRVNDTRVYHEFGSSSLIREFTSKEVDFEAIKSKMPKPPAWQPASHEDLSMLMDSNWVAHVLSTMPSKSSVLKKDKIAL